MKQNEITEELNRLKGEIDALSLNVKNLNEAVSIFIADKAIKEVFEKKNTDENTCNTVSVDCTISLPNLSNWNAEKVEQFNKHKPQDDTIYVPKGILTDNTKEIINGKHTLFHDKDGWNACSLPIVLKSTEKQYKLVQCKRDELEAGDVAFRSEEKSPDFTELNCYCIILNQGYQYWDGKNCSFGNSIWDYWYKVVKA